MAEVRHLALEEASILDLMDHDSDDPERRRRYMRQLQQSLNDLGFLIVSNHQIDLELLDKCYDLSRRFFELPIEEKLALSYRNVEQKHYSNVGYFPYKSETAVASTRADLKEFFHIGPSLPDNHPMRQYYAENVWPSSLPEFHRNFRALYEQFCTCADRIAHSVVKAFGLHPALIQDLTDAGNSILRTIHYPPVDAMERASRAAPHTGIQLLGLQPRTTHPGLQMCLPSGEWIALTKQFDPYIIVNIGEMLAYILNNQVQPTLHQVVNAEQGSEKHDRYCIVFFYHANSLKYLPRLGEPEQQPSAIRAGDWLLQRLSQLGLGAGTE
jgi:isopenicillin N synthase-like dioxygenase